MAFWRNTPGRGRLVLSPTELSLIPELARRAGYKEDPVWRQGLVCLSSVV
jgi:hypothetical protein